MKRLTILPILLLGLSVRAADMPLLERAERVAVELPWYSPGDAAHAHDPAGAPDSDKVAESLRLLRPPTPPLETNFPPAAATVPDAPSAMIERLSGWRLDEIRPLLKHKDPKVRTLGLMLLFDLDRIDVLPEIALLSKDDAESFPTMNDATAFQQIRQSPPDWKTGKSTVADYANAMLGLYTGFLGPDELRDLPGKMPKMTAAEIADRFKQFAAKRDPFLSTAGLRVAMDRARGGVTPIQPDRRQRVQTVVQRLSFIPMPRRFFVTLALNSDTSGSIIGDPFGTDSVVFMARQVPREMRLAAIANERPLDDPDIRPGLGSGFFLEHAVELLRRSDANELLQIEQALKAKAKNTGPVPMASFRIAAAELKPEKASEILNDALKNYANAGTLQRSEAGSVAAALARLGDDTSLQQAVDWFFNAQPVANNSSSPRSQFLDVLNFRSPATYRKVVEKIIRDPRLDTLGPISTRALIEAASGYLGKPLADEEQLLASRSFGDTNTPPRTFEPLGEWRKKLNETVDQWAK